MEFSFRRVNALLKKEFKSLLKNANVLFMCVLPLLFSIIYSNILLDNYPDQLMGKIEILIMCLGMNLVLVASFVISMLIAEEKEKNTLRTLMLSGVSAMEFLTGKIIISFLLSEITNLAIFFIIGMDVKYLGIFLILNILVVICMIGIGAVVGMISPNQMSTGMVGMPVLMFMLLIPLFADLNGTFKNIAKFLPNYNMNLMLRKLFTGEGLGSNITFPLAVIIIWIVVSGAAFVITYHKVGLDK